MRENIAVGDIDQIDNDEIIAEAASKSLAEQVVQEMAEGLEQRLGRRFYNGQEWSGGQWQTVGGARAYMKGAGVRSLDEPTSARGGQAEAHDNASVLAVT